MILERASLDFFYIYFDEFYIFMTRFYLLFYIIIGLHSKCPKDARRQVQEKGGRGEGVGVGGGGGHLV